MNGFEDFYIPFSNGQGRLEYYNNDTFIVDIYNIDLAKNIIENLKKRFHARNLVTKKIVEKICKTDAEYLIYIKSDSLPLLEEYVSLSTRGKDINPFDDRNLPVLYTIPKRDLQPFLELQMQFSQLAKPYLLEDLTRKFILSTCHKTLEDAHHSQLSYIKFIHQQGFWDKYLEYLSKNLK